MKTRKIAALGVTAALLAGGVALAVPASADPVTSGYVLVGSDTLQDSANALVNGTTVTGASVRVVSNGVSLGSYDAFGSSLIRSKATGSYYPRPSGSGAGIDALRASADHHALPSTTTRIDDQVDIARSSSDWGTNADDDGVLVFVPYARDAVSYAYKAENAAAATVLSSLTLNEIKQAYQASASAPFTKNGVAIHPRLPQSASGTRKFFLSVLGLTDSTLGSVVPAIDKTAAGLPENDASKLGQLVQQVDGSTTPAQTNEIIPFSSASWVAQYNGAAPNTIDKTNTLLGLGAPDGVAPFTSSTTGGVTTLTPNSSFYKGTGSGVNFVASVWGRDTYLVVESARYFSDGAKYDASLRAVVDQLTNFSTALPSQVGSVKLKYGFLAPNGTTKQRAYSSL